MRRPNLPILLATAIFASATQPVGAQDVAGKDLKAVRISGEAPRLDGIIDDDTWLAAPSIFDFTQQEPDNMAAPREQTVVQVAYDDRYLYVAVRCLTAFPPATKSRLGSTRGTIT